MPATVGGAGDLPMAAIHLVIAIGAGAGPLHRAGTRPRLPRALMGKVGSDVVLDAGRAREE